MYFNAHRSQPFGDAAEVDSSQTGESNALPDDPRRTEARPRYYEESVGPNAVRFRKREAARRPGIASAR